MQIVHVIPGLGLGGTEMLLERLAVGLARRGHPQAIVSLGEVELIGRRLEQRGLSVFGFQWMGAWPKPWWPAQLARVIRRFHPDLVQSWLYPADMAAALAAPFAGFPPLIWNVRQSNLDPSLHHRRTLWTARGCAWLSRISPARVVVNSKAGRETHVRFGYAPEKFVLIPNGIDTGVFRPEASERGLVRRQWGVGEETVILGLWARWDPQKDHGTFLAALALLRNRGVRVEGVLAGEGITLENRELMDLVTKTGTRGFVRLLGPRDDLSHMNQGLDIAVNTSIGEGWPNAVGEAMACGVPVVVTDVGDSRDLVGDGGVVVPPGRPEALAEAVQTLIEAGSEKRRMIGSAGRSRIQSEFALNGMVDRYESLYQSVLKGSA